MMCSVLLCLLLATAASAEDKPPAPKLLAEEKVKDIGHVALSDKGAELAVCSKLEVQIRDAATLKLARTYKNAGNRAAFALADKSLVVSGVTRTGIELLDRESGESKNLCYGETDFVVHGDVMAYRGEGNDGPTVVLYDLAKQKTRERWDPGAWVGSPGIRGFTAKGILVGDCIETVKNDGKTELLDCVLVWSPPYDKKPKLTRFAAAPSCVALAPDGKTAALGNARDIDIWDLDKGKRTHTLPTSLTGPRVEALAYSADGKRLVALCSRNADRKRGLDDTGEAELIVYDAETHKLLARGEAHRSPARQVALTSDGKRLVTAGRYDGLVRVWSVE